MPFLHRFINKAIKTMKNDKMKIVRKTRSSLSRLIFGRMEIVLMPRFGAGVKFSVYPWALLLFAAAWLALTLYALFAAAQDVDCKIIKADNNIMKTKFAMIAEELSRNRKYIEMSHTTDEQMRQMLGMKGGKHINRPFGDEEEINFKEVFAKNPAEIDEKQINQYLSRTTEMAQARLASFQEIAWFYANQKNISDSTPSIKPTTDAVITSGFGYRLSPFGTFIAAFHKGLDFAGKPNSKIRVTADGVVRHAGWAQGYGQAVLVDHGFGYSTLYGHLADIKVKAGDVVKRGQFIANMGTTGRSTGVHLHYEVWKDGTPVNPRTYF